MSVSSQCEGYFNEFDKFESNVKLLHIMINDYEW